MKCDREGGEEDEGRERGDRGAHPSRNPGYAHEMR